MSEVSKSVLERAKERGYEHLGGPYFKRGESFYYYNASTEAMSIANEDDYQEYVREKESPKQESPKEEPEKEQVMTDITLPTDPKLLEAMELADERQIAEEIKGRVIEQFVYRFEIGGREVVGLSYAGVKQVAREMAKRGEPITIEDLVKEESDTHWTVTAKAVNLATQEHRFGVARQSKVQTFRNGSTKEDDYSLTKCVSKAQRNGLRAFLPEEVIVELIKEWQKKREDRERF